jgi:hypothetical protein
MLISQISYYYSVKKINTEDAVNGKIPEFLFKWWSKYDAMIGDHSNQKRFAEFLGIKEQTFGNLKNGLRKQADLDTVMNIYRATGDKEIFFITGYERFIPPDPSPTELLEKLLSLPPDDLNKLMDAFDLAISSMKETGITINSPEGAEILNSVKREKGLK